MLQMAVLGVGWAGTRHVEATFELGRKVATHCLVDSDRDHLLDRAWELGIDRTYVDFGEALADSEVDCVSICLPHGLHCEAAVSVAEAGKHILCEKPLALTVEEATRMIDAAEAAEVTLYVAESLTYSPMSQFLRQVVTSGDYIGEVVAASTASGFRARPTYAYDGRRAWLSSPELGGTGTWMLHGIHRMAQLRHVLGEVDTVYMREHHARSFGRSDVEGTMSGLLTMAGGFQVSVVQTCEARIRGRLAGYVIHGDEGSLCATEDGCEVYRDSEEPLSLTYPDAPKSEFAQEIEAFADTVAGAAEGPTTGRSERRSLAIVQAGYESAASGAPVNLRERFGEL
jgi:predicted dehydrogenase